MYARAVSELVHRQHSAVITIFLAHPSPELDRSIGTDEPTEAELGNTGDIGATTSGDSGTGASGAENTCEVPDI